MLGQIRLQWWREVIEAAYAGGAPRAHEVAAPLTEVIREHEKEEFVWESRRLGRNVTLSARLSDNSGLEEFMMHEFFDDARPH